MRHLLNTLYILTDDRYLSLDGENIVLQEGNDVRGRYPLHTLEGIACFWLPGDQPRVDGGMREAGISCAFIRRRDDFRPGVRGKPGNVLLRRQQYRTADDLEGSCRIARHMLIGRCTTAAGSWSGRCGIMD